MGKLKNCIALAALLMLVAPSMAVPPVSDADVVNTTVFDTFPNLGSTVWVSAYAYESGVGPANNSRCVMSVYRWNSNASGFVPVQYINFIGSCLSGEGAHAGQVSTITDDCYIFTDPSGEFYHHFYVDPGIFELGDVGQLEIKCGTGIDTTNFTVMNYRPVDSFFGTTFQYLIDNPAVIFGLFVFLLIASVLLVILLVLPIIIFRRLFS